MSNKLGSKDDAGVRLNDMFGTYTAFKKFQTDEDLRKAYLDKCNPSEVEAVGFLEQAMCGNILIHGIIGQCIQDNWLQPAEAILANSEWASSDLLDFQELMKVEQDDPTATAAEEATLMPEVSEPEPQKSTSEEKPDQSQDIVDEVPEGEAGMEEQEQEPPSAPRASAFKVLHVPSWVEDLFQKVCLTTFEQTVHHAKLCASLRKWFRLLYSAGTASGFVYSAAGFMFVVDLLFN